MASKGVWVTPRDYSLDLRFGAIFSFLISFLVWTCEQICGMMSFLETLEKLFNTRDLYQVLSLDKSASESEIKRAYRRKSLEVHPDRVPRAEKVVATEKFQALSRVHSVLSDQDKKAVYDDSGEVEDDIVVQERDWDAYWRILFKKITVEDIREFEASYKGSEEEENDLKSAYIDYEGDMDAIMENVLCATVEDEPRYREIIQRLVDAKEIPKYKKFTNEEKRKKKARKQKVSVFIN